MRPRRRVRVRSPLVEATFELERFDADIEIVIGIEDVRLPHMTHWSFWLVEDTLRRASEAAFAGLNASTLPFEVEDLIEPSPADVIMAAMSDPKEGSPS